MQLITRKSKIKEILDECFLEYESKGLESLVSIINKLILSNRVKFPLLEYCGEALYNSLPEEQQIPLCDQIQTLKTEGGNVILGKILQKRLDGHFNESIAKATSYVADADVWYVCDIIGERVYGVALLNYPEKAIPKLKQLSNHPTNWVIRSIGAGTHYAVKKGLEKARVKTMFKLLLSAANSNDKEVRQGIGWAAKTTAKFHPEIITYYQTDIENTKEVANWFRKKIEIGINRHHYAKRN